MDILGLEIMFADHPVRKKTFLDEQKIGKFLSQFDFGQMSLEIMFDDHSSRKQAFLDYTNIDSKQWPC